MEEDDKGCRMIRMGVSGRVFLLVPAYPGCPGPKAVKRLRVCSFSALMLLVGRQEGHPACKKTEWCAAGVLICLERGADLHMAQLKPLPLTVSCFSKIEVDYLSGTSSPG